MHIFLLDGDKNVDGDFVTLKQCFDFPLPTTTNQLGRNLEKTKEEQTYQFVLSIISCNFQNFFRGVHFETDKLPM